MGNGYFLGIDGGATKTEVVLVDGDGYVTAAARGGGSSIIGEPSAESLGLIKALSEEVCCRAAVKLAQVEYCVLGLNGIDFEDEHETQYRRFQSFLGLTPDRFCLVNDGIAALWGSSSSPRCAILQHGTGFTSAYRSHYGGETLFDHLNVCDCYDIRREALRLIARMNAGVVASTQLLATALACLEVSAESFPDFCYRNRVFQSGKGVMLLEKVFALWEDGDVGAGRLVEGAIDDYVLLLKTMIKKAGGSRCVAVLGGGVVTLAPQRLRVEIAHRVTREFPDVTVDSAAFSPAVGAAVMAAFRAGMDPGEYYQKVASSDAANK